MGRPKMAFLYFDAGGGHRAATTALCSVIREQQRPWEISCLNLQDLLDATDLVRKITGLQLQDFYNVMIKRGWTLGAAPLLRVLHGLIRLYHKSAVELLANHWRETKPDMVVSLIPNFNRQIARSLRQTLPGVPFVTIVTDLADYPPHFWIEPESQFLICGTERAAQQAISMGHAPERVFCTSGMILNPAFYESAAPNIFEERQFLGLERDRATGLVMFGGQGSAAMTQIARRLSSLSNLQLIFICGRNAKLEAELKRMRFRIPVFIDGFTNQVARYMQVSDFFIGKPGPGSISEALRMGLPVIVERNAWTLPQERFNADWILEKEVGMVVPSFRHIERAVERLLQSATMARYRANAAALDNQAVFEIPEILDTIVKKTRYGDSLSAF